MKKWYLSLALIIIFSLTACGGGSGSSSKDSSSTSADSSSGMEVSGEASSETDSSSNSEQSGGVSEVPKSLIELGWKEVANFDIGFCLPPVDGIKQQERYVANGDGPLFQVSYYFETGNYTEDFSADGVPQKNLVSIRQNKVDYACTQDNIGIGGPGFLSGAVAVSGTSYELYSEAGDLYVYRATGGPVLDRCRELLLFHEGDTAYYTITTSNSAFDVGYFTEEAYGMFLGSLKYLGSDGGAEALSGWKVAYLGQITKSVMNWTGDARVGVEDVNGDGIPEVWYRGSSTEQRLVYLDYAGVLRYMDFSYREFQANEGVVYVTGGRQGGVLDTVYVRNKDTGIYVPVFNGSYYGGNDSSYKIQSDLSAALETTVCKDPISRADYEEMLRNALGGDPGSVFSGSVGRTSVERDGIRNLTDISSMINEY